MSQVAKLFINGRSQAVRLPVAYRFDTQEVGTSNNPKFGCKSEQQRPIQIQMNAHWTEFAVFLWCIAPKSAVLADLGRQKAVILASFK